MGRLTTDNPTTNTEALLNFARARDGRVILAHVNGLEDMDLCEYVADLAKKQGCNLTPEAVMDGACLACDCELSVLYTVAVQAAELRARLKAYEDAEEAGKLLKLPCKVGDPVWFVLEDEKESDGAYIPEASTVSEICSKGFFVSGYYDRPDDMSIFVSCNPTDDDHYRLGVDVFLTEEEAKAAIAKMKEERNHGSH